MTIKNIGLSAAAIAVMSTAVFAGSINVENAGKISQELLSFSDVNVTNVPYGAEYTPTAIPATSLKNPIFKYVFANMKNISAEDNVTVIEFKDGNTSHFSDDNVRVVANNPQVSSLEGETSNNVLSFNAVDGNIYVYNGRTYVIYDNDGNVSDDSDSALIASVKGQVAQGSMNNATIAVKLYSGDSQDNRDSAPAKTLYTIDQEWAATISQPLNAQIDAAAGFLSFVANNPEDVHSDKLTIKVTRDSMIDGGKFTPSAMPLVVLSDQNLTANAYTVVGAWFNLPEDGTGINDFNVTASGDSLASGQSVDGNLTYTIHEGEIEKTKFTANFVMTDGDHDFTLIAQTPTNAGEWTIYGYNAQIPNAAATDTTETVLKFTNRSGLNTDIFFTLIDPDGTIATVSSVDNPELAALPKNTTGKYKVSTLLSLVSDPDFDKAHSISIEVAIPTTPSSVYGSASFLNSASGQFKDLPVYNTSSMTY